MQATYLFFFLSNVKNCIDQKWNKAGNQQVKIYMHVHTSEQREHAPLNKR